MRHLRTLLLAVALMAALALVGCSTGTSTPASTGGSTGGATGSAVSKAVTVTMRNFAFDPADATVAVGGTVTFVNNDSTAHDVSVDGADSGALAAGASWSHTFTKAGSFPVQCTIHPQMTGSITVQ
jgi:plastocyanin